MTGLDPEKERIIEIAVLVTDAELNITAEGPHLVIHQAESFIEAMDAWNTKHHGESGLIDRVRESKVSNDDAQAQVLAFLKEQVSENKTPLAGNSIHQDRRFIEKYMPEVEAYLHYRNIDVSTVKELAQRWYPKAYSKRPSKKGNHRAMADIKESIAELGYYREAVFKEAKHES